MPITHDETEYLSVQETMKELGISRGTLYTMDRAKEIKGEALYGRKWYEVQEVNMVKLERDKKQAEG